MVTVKDLMSRSFHTTEDTITVLEAAQQMEQLRIGFLVVVSNNRLVGVLSERDCLFKIVAQRIDPQSIKVGTIMTRKIITITESTTAIEAWKIMKDKHIRHLPVVDKANVPVGVLGIRDIIDKLANDATLSGILGGRR